MIWVALRLAWFQQPGMFNFQAKSRMMNLEFVHPLPFFKSWAAQKQVSGFYLHRPNSGRILPPASPALTALRCQRHWRLRCPAGRLAFGCLFTRQVRSCQFTSVYMLVSVTASPVGGIMVGWRYREAHHTITTSNCVSDAGDQRRTRTRRPCACNAVRAGKA